MNTKPDPQLANHIAAQLEAGRGGSYRELVELVGEGQMVPVEHLRVGDVVRFAATSPTVNVVQSLHLCRPIGEPLARAVTVTHHAGCWTKNVGEPVELLGTILPGD
jgi:hypothetical protein